MKFNITPGSEGGFFASSGIERVSIPLNYFVDDCCKYPGDVERFISSYLQKLYGNVELELDEAAKRRTIQIMESNRLLF